MKNEITLNKKRNVTLTKFIAHKTKTPAILILPGGGYNECSVNEGKPVAEKYNKYGFNAFVLCYSVGKNYKWPYPLDDLKQAMDLIRERADEFNVDSEKIILVGFSAGGHLAGAGATMLEKKPFATVICYGAFSADTIDISAPEAPDIPSKVSFDTCPCFLAQSRNDWIVPISNTDRFVKALEENYIDYESHTYGFSMHGFSIGAEVRAVPPSFCSRVGDWFDESVSWIRDLVDDTYISVRECAEYNDKYGEYLSTMNSVGIVFSNDAAKSAYKKNHLKYYLLIEAAKKQVGDFVNTISIRNVLTYFNVSRDNYKKQDETLGKFKIER